MSPRKNRRTPDSTRAGGAPGTPGDSARSPGGLGGPERTEEGPDGTWIVRPVAGANAVKSYRCPGCDQEISARVPHLVVWPAEPGGPEDRRHWHRPCWEARLRRAPRRRRSRSGR